MSGKEKRQRKFHLTLIFLFECKIISRFSRQSSLYPLRWVWRTFGNEAWECVLHSLSVLADASYVSVTSYYLSRSRPRNEIRYALHARCAWALRRLNIVKFPNSFGEKRRFVNRVGSWMVEGMVGEYSWVIILWWGLFSGVTYNSIILLIIMLAGFT